MTKNLKYQVDVPTLLTPTPSDIEGPYYKPGAPVRTVLTASPNLLLQGRVLDIYGTTVHGAVLDFWQANPEGAYDMVGFNFRGVSYAVAGTYELHTDIPGDYQINENPPDFRCAHLHVKVRADGYKELTTQLYFPADPYNATDHWFDPRRVIQPPQATFNFVLEHAAA